MSQDVLLITDYWRLEDKYPVHLCVRLSAGGLPFWEENKYKLQHLLIIFMESTLILAYKLF